MSGPAHDKGFVEAVSGSSKISRIMLQEASDWCQSRGISVFVLAYHQIKVGSYFHSKSETNFGFWRVFLRIRSETYENLHKSKAKSLFRRLLHYYHFLLQKQILFTSQMYLQLQYHKILVIHRLLWNESVTTKSSVYTGYSTSTSVLDALSSFGTSSLAFTGCQ
jgi:hypothetical protein